MVRNFICALLAVLLALPLVSFIAAEDIPEVVEMPAVVTPMQTAQEETEADASEEASAPEEPSRTQTGRGLPSCSMNFAPRAT